MPRRPSGELRGSTARVPARGRARAGQAAEIERAAAALRGGCGQRGLQLRQLRLAAQRRRAARRVGHVQRGLGRAHLAPPRLA